MPNAHLLIIDPQNDFCDFPATQAGNQPALPVTGADADICRLAQFIEHSSAGLENITITLDTHQYLDIAHHTFWRDANGAVPPPYTQVRLQDVTEGRLLPCRAENLPGVIAYLQQLEQRQRYTHMLWPVHCQLGSWGHAVHAGLLSACNEWSVRRLRNTVYVQKGYNPGTEHYSAIAAEVPDNADETTGVNRVLLAQLAKADYLLVGGEAASHCLRATVEDLLRYLPEFRLPQLVLISDCMSPVSGFEAQAATFFADMQARGVHLMTAQDVLRQVF